MLLYLHGFCSSPASAKTTRLREFMAERGLEAEYWCEQLPVSAPQAMALVEAVIARCPAPPTLVGSSLGGFYATYLAEKHGLKAAVINPLVWGALDSSLFLGEHANFHSGERFIYTEADIAALGALHVPAITRPERYWLLAEEADEVLDCAAAVRFYAGARHSVLPGGNHSFTRFDDYLQGLLAFAGLESASAMPL